MDGEDRSDRKQPSTAEWARSTAKNPDDFEAGGVPMTEHQRSHLKVLSEEAGEPFDESLTQDEAERRIDELQRRSGNKP